MLAPRVSPDDVATVIFSSGSTGTPKGVMLTHFNIASNIESIAQVYWVTKSDCIIGVLPFFHSFGFAFTLWFPLLSGFSVAYHANPMDGKAIGELVRKHKATFLLSTPTFCAGYVRKCSKEEFSTLRCVLVGAEKLRESIATSFHEKFGLPLLEGYGCTEMSPVVAVNFPDYDGADKQTGCKPGTVGQPVPGVAVRVVNPETFEPVAQGTEGLLLVNGPNRMAGYLGQAEKTAEVLRDGWYVTGDIVALDDEGFIRITDRLARFSKIGGEMVPHGRIEEAVSAIIGDAQCMVTSVPDEQRGERLVVLYTRQDMEPGELWAKLSETDLPKLWVPKKDSLYRVEAIPALGTGKADLRGGRKLALELAGA
jgi:acyl-[acyl-carrier-protein]-phospholipid O-acyltransferase/long-chain-fatty-acid--[acyl-carrier-protein] ligase